MQDSLNSDLTLTLLAIFGKNYLSATQHICQQRVTHVNKNYFTRWQCWWVAGSQKYWLYVSCIFDKCFTSAVPEDVEQTEVIFKMWKVLWILFQFALTAVNDLGNCVSQTRHSLHPIDWELNTQEQAVRWVAVYLRWWLQSINFDGCHFAEKTMGVGMSTAT